MFVVFFPIMWFGFETHDWRLTWLTPKSARAYREAGSSQMSYADHADSLNEADMPYRPTYFADQ